MVKYLLSSFIFITTLYAHPHTFIDVFPTIGDKNGKIDTIHIQWRYDEMASELMIMEFDVNMNGKIDKDEIPYIKRNFFDIAKDIDYYTDIRISGKKIKTNPKNFTAKIINGINIAFEYDVRVNAPKNKVKVEFYDTDMYTAFMLKKDFVKSKLGFKIVDMDHDFYFSYRLQFN